MNEGKPTTGYFFIAPIFSNPYATASLDEIVAQLRSCSYRCEAGPLELNLAFIELMRRAAQEEVSDKKGR